MKFNIGDEVSFLNEKLDAKIHSIISSTIVKVETEDGFVIDALASELVLVKKTIKDNDQKTTVLEQTVSTSSFNKEKTFTFKQNTIQFISAPAQDNKLMTGNISFFIYNCSEAEIFYALFEQIGKEKIIKNKGVLNSGSYINVADYNREELIGINNFICQFVFTGDGYRHPLVKDIPVIIPSLTDSFINPDGTKSFATYFELANFNPPKDEELTTLKDTFHRKFEPPLERVKSERKAKNSDKDIHNQGLLQNTATVDLHIEELTSDFSGLSHSGILSVQIKYAVQEMEKALKNNYHSLIFIHGVGNGKLKEALRIELKKYSGIHYRDADYSRYGGGATEVLF